MTMVRGILCLTAGCALLLWFAHVILFGTLPTLLLERAHLAEFRPALAARVQSANCTNYEVILFHQCTIVAVTPEGNRFEVSEAALGRAPTGRVGLLAAPGSPPVYTTTAALEEMPLRIATLCLSVTMALAAGLLAIALPFLTVHGARRSGMTVRDYLESNTAMVRQRRQGRH